MEHISCAVHWGRSLVRQVILHTSEQWGLPLTPYWQSVHQCNQRAVRYSINGRYLCVQQTSRIHSDCLNVGFAQVLLEVFMQVI